VLLLFAFWIFRPGYRSATAGTKSRADAASASTDLHAANRDTEDDYLKGRFYWTSPRPKV
jgi:hypothetical protein